MPSGRSDQNKKHKPKPTPKPTATFPDPSVGPANVYDPSDFNPVKAYQDYQKNAPPKIKRLLKKQKHYQDLNFKEQERYKKDHPKETNGLTKQELDAVTAWQFKAPTKAPSVREQQALGVAGGRVYEIGTGKFLGYSDETQFQQYLPKPGDETTALGLAATTSGFKAPVQAPRYFAGDENKPASWGDAAKIADLQTRLKAAHMYGPSATYSQGSWGEEDVAAYGNALSAANRAGVDVDTYLDQKAKAPYIDEDTDKRDPVQIHLARPEDIRQVANETAKEIYGGYLSQSAIDSMVEMFHQQQIQAQNAEYNTQKPGGMYPDEPDLDTFVEQQIKQKYPNEVAATKFGTEFDNLIGMLTQ